MKGALVLPKSKLVTPRLVPRTRMKAFESVRAVGQLGLTIATLP